MRVSILSGLFLFLGSSVGADPPKKEPPKYETVKQLDARGKAALAKLKVRDFDGARAEVLTRRESTGPPHYGRASSPMDRRGLAEEEALDRTECPTGNERRQP